MASMVSIITIVSIVTMVAMVAIACHGLGVMSVATGTIVARFAVAIVTVVAMCGY